MKRTGLLLLTALALAVPAAPASARVLYSSTAYGVANSVGVQAQRANPWASHFTRGCTRATFWRYSCHLELVARVDPSYECQRWFDVVASGSPFSSRVWTENATRWACG